MFTYWKMVCAWVRAFQVANFLKTKSNYHCCGGEYRQTIVFLVNSLISSIYGQFWISLILADVEQEMCVFLISGGKTIEDRHLNSIIKSANLFVLKWNCNDRLNVQICSKKVNSFFRWPLRYRHTRIQI